MQGGEVHAESLYIGGPEKQKDMRFTTEYLGCAKLHSLQHYRSGFIQFYTVQDGACVWLCLGLFGCHRPLACTFYVVYQFYVYIFT